MPTTYVLIASQVTSATPTSVTFSSIPQTYTDLVLRTSARSSRGSSAEDIRITFNGSSSSTYSVTILYGSGSTPTVFTNTVPNQTAALGAGSFFAMASGDYANSFNEGEVYIPNYTSGNNKAHYSVYATEAPIVSVPSGFGAGLWRDTAAINSLTITLQNGSTFVNGSSFYLYGIKNS